MVLFIDNYDSFTYNLVQYVGEINRDIRVVRNDECTLDEIAAMKPSHIVVSPGPGTPTEAGVSIAVIKKFHTAIPILGVCLGHQAIGEAFGGSIIRAPEIMHGKLSMIHHTGDGVFKGIPSPFAATRYHSLIIDAASCPKELTVTAKTENGLIMGVRHEKHPLFGVQFHPESIATEHGKAIIRNFLKN
ncbi:MAG: aminodeoxychorismate/anthranilate synthase component II [Spirochaetes bacterium]|nr:aminodeoxychorismate/anthranilate synthase component II [Spirochaetota bacterium]